MASSLSVERMQLSDDPDDWIWVRWVWARPDATPLFWTCYGHPIWEKDEAVNRGDGPRIILEGGVYAPSRTDPGPCGGYIGEPEWYRSGIPLEARATGEVIVRTDGEVWGIEVPLTYSVLIDDSGLFIQAGVGGQVQGGESVQGRRPEQVGAGGQAQGGAAPQGPATVQVGAGGQEQGGEAEQSVGRFQAGVGGQVQGGEAEQSVGRFQAGVGGQVQGGEAGQSVGRFQAGVGGQVQGAEAEQLPAYFQAGVGGQQQGGEATQTAAYYQTGAGGQVQGGTAAQRVGFRQTGAGGQEQGGTAVQIASPHLLGVWRSLPATTTSTLVTIPAGNAGELILVAGLKSSTATDFTDPAGWTRLTSGANGSTFQYGLWYRFRVGGDPATVTFGWGGASLFNAFMTLTYNHAGAPSAYHATTGSSTTASDTGVTVDVLGELVAFLFATGTSETVPDPSGMDDAEQTDTDAV